MAAAPPASPPGTPSRGEAVEEGVASPYLVELEHVGAEADAVALVDADVERHAAERGAPGAARERHVAGLPAELHEAPPRAGLGEAQAEVGREVEPRAQRPHGLLPDLHPLILPVGGRRAPPPPPPLRGTASRSRLLRTAAVAERATPARAHASLEWTRRGRRTGGR